MARCCQADFLIAPLSQREAVLSSRIEGTVATSTDLALYEAAGEARLWEPRRAELATTGALARPRTAERAALEPAIRAQLHSELMGVAIEPVAG
jgi:hypothetical protein